MACIAAVDVELFRVPLGQTLVDALHGDHTHFELVLVTVCSEDGNTGTGYTYTGGTGGRAIRSLVHDDLRPVILGADSTRIGQLWSRMQQRLHYVGRGGLVSFAVAAVDIAVWDLHLKRTGQSLWRAIGGRTSRCRCYRGGIDLDFSTAELVASVERYKAEGHNAVKIKVGRPSLEDDIARCKAVREALGPGCSFMVDANMAMSPERAIRFSRTIAPLDVLWFEEPTTPGSYADFARVRAEGGIAVAQGENLHTLEEFRHALVAGAADFVQPDASNCGGITGFLKVATLAEAFDRPTCSHGMQELHISLVGGVPNGGWAEIHSFPIDLYTTAGPVVVVDGYAEAPDVPGTGVAFNLGKLEPYKVAARQ